MPEITTTTLLIVFAATATLIVVIWAVVSWWFQAGRGRVEQRARVDDSDPSLLLDSMYGRQGRFGWWDSLSRWATERMERTELGMTAAEGASVVLICGVVLAAVFFFWRYEEEESWMAIPAFFGGAALPLAVFWLRQRHWRQRLQDQLPDMLFLMARSLRAGMSIDQSIAVLGEHGVAPMSREFARMYRQLELGLAIHQVLKITADRLRLVDFSVFASVLSLHRSTGGNLPVLMDRLAQTTRDHNQLRGYYRTATSLGRYGNIILFVLAGVMVAYLAFFQNDLSSHYFDSLTGITLFGIGVGLMVIAGVVYYFLVRRDDL